MSQPKFKKVFMVSKVDRKGDSETCKIDGIASIGPSQTNSLNNGRYYQCSKHKDPEIFNR